MDGTEGEKQFSDQKVQDATVVDPRNRVKPIVDSAIKPEQVDLNLKLKDGRTLHKHIEHAIGSVEMPMSDSALEAKFTDLCEGVLSRDRTKKLMELCWNLVKLSRVSDIAKAAVA